MEHRELALTSRSIVRRSDVALIRSEFDQRIEKDARSLNLLGFAVFSLLLCGGIFWASIAEISGAVVASGKLQSQSGKKPIDHFKGGIVEEILVTDGDHVTVGQVLVRLDSVSEQAQIKVLDSELDVLLPRLFRLKAEAHGHDKMTPDDNFTTRLKNRTTAAQALADEEDFFETRANSLRQKTSQIKENIAVIQSRSEGSNAVVSALNDRIDSLDKELELKRRLLEQGLIELRRITSLERERHQLQGQRAEILWDISGTESEVAELRLRSVQIMTDFQKDVLEEMNSLQFEIAAKRAQRISLENDLSNKEIRAPQDGVVLDMEIKSVGGAIRPGEPVMYIVPSNDNLIVSARVQVMERDKIWPQQVANIVFSGLDQKKMPDIQGRVMLVSADTLEDERTGDHYYEVDIVLSADSITRIENAANFRLVAGMPVEVFLTTQNRTVLDYLLEPLSANLRYVFRES